MRVTISTPRTGIAYLPGLAQPQSVDVEALPDDIASRIESCIFALRSQGATASDGLGGMRDDVSHSVVVEQADGSTFSMSGPPTGAMRELIAAVHEGLRSVPRKPNSGGA